MTDLNAIREGILAMSQKYGYDPLDLGTAISYETGGTFNPEQPGPTTQWGQHKGLFQAGEPQAQKYFNNDFGVEPQLEGLHRYFQDTGYKPGMPFMDMYSAINAGGVGRYNASDANNGGAPGTVADKVNNQMAGHRQKAAELLGMSQHPSHDPRIGQDVQLAGIETGGGMAGIPPEVAAYATSDDESPLQKIGAALSGMRGPGTPAPRAPSMSSMGGASDGSGLLQLLNQSPQMMADVLYARRQGQA